MCGGGGREKKERVLGGEAGGRRRGTCGGEYLSSACIERVHTARARVGAREHWHLHACAPGQGLCAPCA